MTLVASILWILTASTASGVSSTAQAAEETMHEGTVVSISANMLVMTDPSGKQAQYHLADSVQVTINGKLAKPAGLKPGMRIHAMTNQAGEVTVISTIDEHKAVGGRAATQRFRRGDPG